MILDAMIDSGVWQAMDMNTSPGNVHAYAATYQGPPSRPPVQKKDRQTDRQPSNLEVLSYQTHHHPLISPIIGQT